MKQKQILILYVVITICLYIFPTFLSAMLLTALLHTHKGCKKIVDYIEKISKHYFPLLQDKINNYSPEIIPPFGNSSRREKWTLIKKDETPTK